jgi:F-type H+-transporting ATPase subunit b
MNITSTLIAQSVVFIVFVWICMRFIWPVLIEAMRQRQEAIAAGLQAAEDADRRLQEAKSGAEDELAKAKEEAQAIIEQARGRAQQMVEAAKEEAREEGARLKEAARAEIDQEVNRAKESLRAQVATLAVQGAEKVLGESVDAAKHSDILDRLAAEL